MHVERRPLDRGAADALDRMAGDSLFHSSGFLELWRARGGRPVAWTLADAGGIVAALGGVEFGRAPLDRFTALPDGCPGGVVTPLTGADREHAAAWLRAAIAARGYARVHLFEPDTRVADDPAYRCERHVTRRVHVSDSPGWPEDPGLRSQIRKGARSGLTVTSYDPARHRDAFLALADATYRRHGVTPRFAPEFYDALAALSRRDPRVLWRCCEHRGTLVASHVYLRERDVLHAWQSCFDRRSPWLRAGMFLRDAVAREAARGGIEWLELGATPVGATGLAAYKRRWGGHAMEHVTRVRLTALGTLAERFRGWRDAAPPAIDVPVAAPAAPAPAAGAVR